MARFSLWWPVAAVALASCQDIIDIELPEGETRLIVNGRVTDGDSARVDVKWSVPYLNTNPNEPVTNALVVLYEDGVAVDTLPHRANGRYQSGFRGEVGRNYRATVQAELHVAAKIKKPLTGRLVIEIKASPPDKRRRDLDNILKALLDSITHAGLIEDDSQFDAIAIARMPAQKPGRVDVTIFQLENL